MRRPGGAAHAAWLAALLALLVAAGLARPLLPVDETRYAAVAWDMWLRHDWLVPHLNGETYSHKPPLLFWLVEAGWAAFGVNEWWPRLVSPLFAAGTLVATTALARGLWPERPAIARMAPFVLLSALLYAYFASALMFDAMLAFFVALGLLGIVRAWRQADLRGGFALFALGLAGALYSKGPVALAHLLPAAVLAPWWMRERRPAWRPWALATIAALVVAALAVLAWAVPAAIAGGPAYGRAIFWGQTAGRMSESFAHAAPWYAYLVALPGLLAPWLAWPRWWRGWATALREDSGLRLVLLILVLCLLLFSAVSGKRWHYLLPEFPLFALLVARALSTVPAPGRWSHALPAATLIGAGAVAVAVAPRLAARLGGLEDALALIPGGAVAAAAGAALLALRPGEAMRDVRRIATAALVAQAALMVAVQVAMREPYDLHAVASRVAAFEHEGRPVAFAGGYHGQWSFAGRLRAPLQEIDPDQAAAWLAAHPQGRVLLPYRKTSELPAGLQVLYTRRYRGQSLAILGRG